MVTIVTISLSADNPSFETQRKFVETGRRNHMKNRNQLAKGSTSRPTCKISLAQLLPAISQSPRLDKLPGGAVCRKTGTPGRETEKKKSHCLKQDLNAVCIYGFLIFSRNWLVPYPPVTKSTALESNDATVK